MEVIPPPQVVPSSTSSSSRSNNNNAIPRRRKKRMIGGGPPPHPGSSLTSLNKGSIRVVEVWRGGVGYGFTISGQKPCLLRCIVEGSPASKANLRPGDCLVGVNGRDVSNLGHDEVVRLIGGCRGLLRLHIADSYFSSDEDEGEEIEKDGQENRPKYHHHNGKFRGKSSKPANKTTTSEEDSMKNISITPPPPSYSSYSSGDVPMRRPTWDPIMSSPRRVPRRSKTEDEEDEDLLLLLGEESPLPALPKRTNRNTNANIPPTSSRKKSVESVRVFESSSKPECQGEESNINFKKNTTSDQELLHFPQKSSTNLYQAVVGYVGSIELPRIEERKRLQALTACIRRLRVERRMRSIVLLRIQGNGISLYTANITGNGATGPPLAFYSSRIISFCGAYNEDRRFFGLVTSTSPQQNSCSCHVFMVDPKLLGHSEHLKKARAFGLSCTQLPVPRNAQVLGLQECGEFPATADPVLSAILRFHSNNSGSGVTTVNSRGVPVPVPPQRKPQPHPLQKKRSPSSEASSSRQERESANSSNSDSGVGFRDESELRCSARVYDIVGVAAPPAPPPPPPQVPLNLNFNSIGNSSSTSSLREYSNRSTMPLSSPPVSTSSYSHSQHSGSGMDSTRFSIQSQHSQSQQGSKSSSFNTDPNSLGEILHSSKSNSNSNSNSDKRKSQAKPAKPSSKPSLQSQSQSKSPEHIEVAVEINKKEKEDTSPTSNVKHERRKSQLARYGTRSLDDLCSADVFTSNGLQQEEQGDKGNLGSTPVLNQEVAKSHDASGGFKVPRPPKPKKGGVNRMDSWAESIEKLLNNDSGREIFTEFLQHEFSAENIYFYNACMKFQEAYSNLTESQRISLGSTIFQTYLQNGAPDPVNVDFQARSQVEKLLSQPTQNLFELPLSQVFNLLKFDCYPRFLRSDLYRDYCNGTLALPRYEETSDSDQDSVKSSKLDGEGRRRSLLPWNIKSRSKHKKNKDADRLNSDISFIQQTAMNQNQGESSDTDDGRRQSYKLCRVTLPDSSTTVLPCKPGERLSNVVQRLLEKREFHYSAFEVINVATGKAMDMTLDVSEMPAKEIRVEPRAFIGIELPKGWKVGVRASPFRKVAEVLKPILSQHSIKLDSIVVYDIDTEEQIDVKCQMALVDGHNLLVNFKCREITNHMQDEYFELDDDDMISTKTGSSQGSSVFRGFLRMSSKKYRKKDNKGPGGPGILHGSTERIETPQKSVPSSHNNENLHGCASSKVESSPLSLVSCELKLSDSSRIRKPIYVAPSLHDGTEIDI